MKILEKLERNNNFWFLLLASFVFFILRLPSLFEPYWYGDEGVYEAVGLALRHGRLLYQGVWDNKPPLLYLLYASLNSDQFLVRLLSLIFGLISVIVFFYLSKKLFKSFGTSVITTSIFVVFFGLPILEGNIANSENFMVLPTLVSALILLNLNTLPKKKDEAKNLFMVFSAGALLGISFLFKIVAVFDFGAFLIFIFFTDKNLLSHLKERRYLTFEVKKLFCYTGGFLIFPILTALLFVFQKTFTQFMDATFFSNIGYVGYGNKFFIPQGLLILKVILLLLFSLLLFLKRKALGMTAVFSLLWFSFSIFNAFFSQRPYTHYLLVFLPSFTILLGLIIDSKKFRLIYTLFLLLSLILIIRNFNFYANIPGYYGNFLSFELGKESVSDYQRFFDQMTPTDYQLASFLKENTRPSDYIFTWGNNAQLYKLTDKVPPGRYTVAYHITGNKNGISETGRDLKLKKPKFIIIMPYMQSFPFQLSNYRLRLIISKAYVYERIF